MQLTQRQQQDDLLRDLQWMAGLAVEPASRRLPSVPRQPDRSRWVMPVVRRFRSTDTQTRSDTKWLPAPLAVWVVPKRRRRIKVENKPYMWWSARSRYAMYARV